MIIIKSQSGNTILKCEIINKNQRKQIIANYVRLIDGEGSVSEEYDLLGEYETTKRTEEVMDMIEEHIRGEYADKAVMEHMSIESFSAPAFELIDRIVVEAKKSAIFTMPKE